MRGQTSVEYLMMLSIVLTILALLTYYSASITEGNREDIMASDATIAVNKIAEAANIVYTQGDSSQITLSVYIPETVSSVVFSNNMIIMKLNSGYGENDVLASSKATFAGSSFISNVSGTENVEVSSVEIGGVSYVNVTEG